MSGEGQPRSRMDNNRIAEAPSVLEKWGERKGVRIAAALMLLAYVALLCYWMTAGFGRSSRPGTPASYNLVPFRTIWLYLSPGTPVSLQARLINLLGNVAVFMPVGFLLPVVLRSCRRLLGLALWFLPFILLMETLQLVLRVGSFDVDDVLLNLLGVWAGALALRVLLRVPAPVRSRRNRHKGE